MSIDKDSLESVLGKIRAQYGDSSVRDKSRVSSIKRISTGDLMLDYVTGGGYPMGRIVHEYGGYSSAKTLVAWNIIRNAQAQGMKCIYYNAEKQFDPVWVKRWGVDTDTLEVIEGTIIEEIGEQMEALLGVANIHIVDSVASCVSQDELATKAGDWLPGIAARTWGKTIRRVNNRLDDQENMIILINQTREMFGRGGEMPTGGKAIDFMSSLSLRFRRSSWLYLDKNNILQEEGKGTATITGDKEPDGIEFMVRADKSRVSRPFGTARMRFNFQTLEFDDLWSLVRAASHFNVVKSSGSWYTLPDGSKVQGQNGIRTALQENPEFKAEVTKRIIEAA